MDDFKRVSVVDDMAVQAYIALRNAMLAMRGMYQEKADKARALVGKGADATLDAYRAGVAYAYEQVASEIGRFLNVKGGEKK